MFSSLLGWIYGKHRTRLGIDQLEGLAKVYRFNLSNAAEQTQTEISPEMMKNVAETVFNELEEKIFSERPENTELPNPAEHLCTNEPDLTLDISNIINLQSSIFYSNVIDLDNNENEESDDESSDEDGEDDEYDVNEIILSVERMQCT